MPHLVIGRYTLSYGLSFVNILLSLFVIIVKMGKVSFSYSTCKFWYHPTQSWSGTPPNKACTRQVGLCAFFKFYSGFKFFPLPNRIHARPLAGNAHR